MNEATRLKTPNGVGEAFLVPAFVTEQEEAYLLTKTEELGGTPVEDDEQTASNGDAQPSPRKFKSKVCSLYRSTASSKIDRRVYYAHTQNSRLDGETSKAAGACIGVGIRCWRGLPGMLKW